MKKFIKGRIPNMCRTLVWGYGRKWSEGPVVCRGPKGHEGDCPYPREEADPYGHAGLTVPERTA